MASNGSDVPLIGITTYLEQSRFGLWDLPAAVLMKSYLDCVTAAGGMPVMLPPVGSWQQAHVSRLDGLVVAGGADIDPGRYDQAPHERTRTIRPERDTSELALLHLALRADLPVLGVCRGMQLINIAMGGTLHQHVPEVYGSDSHNPKPGVYGSNEIKLASGKTLDADIIITATGLKLQFGGGAGVSVDGEPYHMNEKFIWRGALLQDLPNFTFANKFRTFLSSNGNLPVNSAYKITPQLQISVAVPVYLNPLTISGLA